MHETQRTEAVRALDSTLVQIYPALVAVRHASPKQLESSAAEYKKGLSLAGDALDHYYNSKPIRVLRFLLRDQATAASDLPDAVADLRDALRSVADVITFDVGSVESAWQRFVTALAKVGVLVDEVPVGSPFDPERHDAVASSPGTKNDTIRGVLTPGLAAHGVRVVWARVRTGPELLA